MTIDISSPLTLPCGSILPNRLAKSAMTEGLATAHGVVTPELIRLYEIWSDGGAGLLIAGNIHIDQKHLERPGNVVIQGELSPDAHNAMRQLTQAGTRNGNHFWAQISHAGRQTQKVVNPHPKAPSAVKLGLPGGQFATPVALTHDEIIDLSERFAEAALVCKNNGFTGVQIHAAHGYLLSSFLNPLANIRNDEYGGSIQNRARFLLDVIAATRAKVGDDYPISVKLNSADFQKGGLSFSDSLQVAKWLEKAKLDLLEISGGNYEQPALIGAQGITPTEQQNVAPSTAAREAYFVDFAHAMQHEITMPILVTGGFRTRSAMNQALSADACDMIGLARPLCVMPDGAKQLLAGLDKLPTVENDLRLIPNWLGALRRLQMFKALDGFAVIFWFYGQLYALGRTGKTNPNLKPFKALLEVEKMNKKLIKQAKS